MVGVRSRGRSLNQRLNLTWASTYSFHESIIRADEPKIVNVCKISSLHAWFDVVRDSYTGTEQRHWAPGLTDALGHTKPRLDEVRTGCARDGELWTPEDVGVEQHHVRELAQEFVARSRLPGTACARNQEQREPKEAMLVTALRTDSVWSGWVNDLVWTIYTALHTDVQHLTIGDLDAL